MPAPPVTKQTGQRATESTRQTNSTQRDFQASADVAFDGAAQIDTKQTVRMLNVKLTLKFQVVKGGGEL